MIWHKLEEDIMRHTYPTSGRAITQCVLRAMGFRRSRGAIKTRAHRLSLTYTRWTGLEDWVLTQTYPEFGSRYCQRYMPRRSLNAIRDRVRRLGLRASGVKTKTQKAEICAMEGHDHIKALAWQGVKYRGE